MTKFPPALLFAFGLTLAGVHSAAAKDAPAAATKSTLETTLAKDQSGKSPATIFTSADAAIYLHYQGKDLKKGDKIGVAWYIVDGGKTIDKNFKASAGTQEANRNGAEGYFNLAKPAAGFPPGKWRVNVTLNGAQVASHPFTVSK